MVDCLFKEIPLLIVIAYFITYLFIFINKICIKYILNEFLEAFVDF